MLEKCRGPNRRTTPRCVRCVQCLGVLLLLIIIVAVIFLVFFKIKEPKMTFNKITLNQDSDFLGTNTTAMIVDVSLNNPNWASFLFENTTSNIYYRGVLVGEAHGPPGKARAKDTLRTNLTANIDVGLMLTAPDATNDMVSGLFTLDTNTRIPGRVKVLRYVKQNVVVRVDCKVTINLADQNIHDQSCKSHVDLEL